jgi:hypothetical protein
MSRHKREDKSGTVRNVLSRNVAIRMANTIKNSTKWDTKK